MIRVSKSKRGFVPDKAVSWDTKQGKEAAIMLRREGMSWTHLGAFFARHPETIRRWFVRHKVATGKNPVGAAYERSRETVEKFNTRKPPKHPMIRIEMPVYTGFEVQEVTDTLKKAMEAYR